MELQNRGQAGGLYSAKAATRNTPRRVKDTITYDLRRTFTRKASNLLGSSSIQSEQ
jgi:hypothetical protein